MIVSRKVSFDAAHFLPGYQGKCSQMHGHHWVVELAVEGEVKDNGMVIDFVELKKFLGLVEETFDHGLVNDTIKNPTAENICLWIEDRFKLWKTDVRLNFKEIGVGLAWIKVWESEDSYAMAEG